MSLPIKMVSLRMELISLPIYENDVFACQNGFTDYETDVMAMKLMSLPMKLMSLPMELFSLRMKRMLLPKYMSLPKLILIKPIILCPNVLYYVKIHYMSKKLFHRFYFIANAFLRTAINRK